MAKLESKITVSLEKIIHRELRNVLQHVWDDHGLRIESISADWMDVSTAGEINMRLMGVQVVTSTKVG